MKKHFKHYRKKFLELKLEYRIILTVLSVLILWMLSGIIAGNNAEDTSIDGKSDAPIYESRQSTAMLRHIKVRLNGTVEADKVIELRPEATGYVEKIVAIEGQELPNGAVIMKIDSKSTLAKLNDSKVKLERAEIAYESELALDKKSLSSELKLKQSLSELTRAKAELSEAQQEFDQTTITMPFDGIVDNIYVEEGDLVSPSAQQAAARVLSTEHYKVRCYIPEAKINLVHLAQDVRVFTRTYETSGSIVNISRVANPNTKTYDAEIILTSNDGTLKTGMGVYVEIPVGEVLAHLLPLSAININDEGEIIIKYIEDDIVKAAVVNFVDETPEGIWVKNLPPEALVIIMGGNNVKTGTYVNAIE